MLNVCGALDDPCRQMREVAVPNAPPLPPMESAASDISSSQVSYCSGTIELLVCTHSSTHPIKINLLSCAQFAVRHLNRYCYCCPSERSHPPWARSIRYAVCGNTGLSGGRQEALTAVLRHISVGVGVGNLAEADAIRWRKARRNDTADRSGGQWSYGGGGPLVGNRCKA